MTLSVGFNPVFSGRHHFRPDFRRPKPERTRAEVVLKEQHPQHVKTLQAELPKVVDALTTASLESQHPLQFSYGDGNKVGLGDQIRQIRITVHNVGAFYISADTGAGYRLAKSGTRESFLANPANAELAKRIWDWPGWIKGVTTQSTAQPRQPQAGDLPAGVKGFDNWF